MLFTIDTLEVGGAEQSLFQIVTRFEKIEPVVCHLYKGEVLKQKFEEAGIKVISLNIEGKYNFLKAYKCLLKVCELEKPELIVSALFRSELISRFVAKKKHVPLIGSFVSDNYSDNKRATLSFIQKIGFYFFYLLNRLTTKYVTAFVANSKSVKDSNAKALNIPRGKIEVIYRGREFKNNLTKRKRKEILTFLNVGRLIKGKGQLELIRAFSEFLKTNPNSRLTIAGEGPYRVELEKEIFLNNLEGKVLLLGNIDNVWDLYRENDCLVFPSHYEGFSGVLIEAMLSEIPILASNIPMNLEAITHGITGYIFEVKDSVSILKALVWFKQNFEKANEMSKNAFIVAKNEFEISSIVKKHEYFYHKIHKEYFLK